MSGNTTEDRDVSRRDLLKSIGVTAGAATLGISQMSGEAQAQCEFPEDSDYATDHLNPVPGGAPIWVFESESSGDGEEGTAGAPFYHPDYDSYGWIMSGHVAQEEEKTVYQDDETEIDTSDEIGVVKEIDIEYDTDGEAHLVDYAFVEATEADQIFRMADEDYSDYEEYIEGFVEDETLEDMIDDEDAFYVQGRSTGRNHTTIESVEERDGDIVAVKTSGEPMNGDSGGALFYKDGDEAYIAGILTGDEDCQSIFTTAETIQDRTGGFF